MQAEQIKQLIKQRKMNYFQIIAISVCVLISMVDGYDVMTIAFVAPTIADLWSLSAPQLGFLFSAGLAGMVAGALFITPFADKFGRRVVIMLCLLLLTIGMLASAFCENLTELVLTRFFSGLAIGAIMPSINTVIAEYASDRSRSFAIGIMAASYTSGSVIGGISYLILIKQLGWSYVFLLGSAFSCILLPLAFWLLPESLDFILLRNNANSLIKLNSLLAKLELSTCATFPETATKSNYVNKQFSLFLKPAIMKATTLMTASVACMMLSFYFLINWTPKILVNFGYTKDVSVTGSLLMNIFGIMGGLSIGWLSQRYSVQKVCSIMAITAFCVVICFDVSSSIMSLLVILIALIGYTTFGAMAGLYAIAPNIFPPMIRATGTGFVFGLARLIGTLGPYIAGLLMAAKLPQSYCFLIMSLPLLVSAGGIIFVKPYSERLH